MYELKSRVRYSETGMDARLSLVGILNYMQDCSTMQSEDLGVGLKFLAEKKRAWLLSSWQIEIGERPLLGTPITVGTWSYGFKGIYGYRDFVIRDESGRDLVRADSLWFLIDTETGRPARVTEEFGAVYGAEPPLPMERESRKIALPDELSEAGRCEVLRHQLDTNHHVNNAQYVDLACELLPAEQTIRSIRAEYKKAAVLGDTLVLMRGKIGDGCVISLQAPDGTVYANVEVRG